MIYAGATQINAIVPWGLQGATAQVTVQSKGEVSAPFSAMVANAVPGIFQMVVAEAPHQAAVINQDGTANSPANPAPLGSIVSLYVTGLGPEMPVPADGSVTPDARHLAVNPISVMFFGGVPGQVLWAGSAPGLLAGVSQINARLPQALPKDAPNLSAVVVLIQSGQSYLSKCGADNCRALLMLAHHPVDQPAQNQAPLMLNSAFLLNDRASSMAVQKWAFEKLTSATFQNGQSRGRLPGLPNTWRGSLPRFAAGEHMYLPLIRRSLARGASRSNSFSPARSYI